mmetsp:Transcript_14404/g.40901  ORF Transcript_14404/g.40901 Transcript_14404/m.40901 type:complete len:241 (+) Transcript_14404:1102-1824(+)
MGVRRPCGRWPRLHPAAHHPVHGSQDQRGGGLHEGGLPGCGRDALCAPLPHRPVADAHRLPRLLGRGHRVLVVCRGDGGRHDHHGHVQPAVSESGEVCGHACQRHLLGVPRRPQVSLRAAVGQGHVVHDDLPPLRAAVDEPVLRGPRVRRHRRGHQQLLLGRRRPGENSQGARQSQPEACPHLPPGIDRPGVLHRGHCAVRTPGYGIRGEEDPADHRWESAGQVCHVLREVLPLVPGEGH